MNPTITVAVCTRDRAAMLKDCLESLLALQPQPLEILVVDNAPRTEETAVLLTHYPTIRYLREPRPGLNNARNKAVAAASGELVAFVDDDVIVSPDWAERIAAVFAEDPQIMAVTGMVQPYELETEAQRLFEQYGGFGRGSERKVVRVNPKSGYHRFYHGTGQFGTGANMAFRRSVFTQIGPFDPALDVGTPTNGGGDLDAFFRVLKHGFTLVYEPTAVVYHRHRRTYTALREQLTNNGIGLYAFLMRSAQAYPDERLALLAQGVWWLLFWNVGRLLTSFVRPDFFPRDLILAELRGSFVGLRRYQQSQRKLDRETAVSPLEPTTL